MMETKRDQKVQEVHKCPDAFELRVLERPTPTTDMSSFRTELASLWADVDAILAILAVEPQGAPSALGDDTILGALFNRDDVEEQPEPARARVRVIDSTTDGAVLVDAGTTEGDPSVDLAGSGKPDSPAC
uniref:Integrase core domain containing protein n=1 Tax=Solanum tuberosum TaxID=4113 RepID=M1DQ92_SOLTU